MHAARCLSLVLLVACGLVLVALAADDPAALQSAGQRKPNRRPQPVVVAPCPGCSLFKRQHASNKRQTPTSTTTTTTSAPPPDIEKDDEEIPLDFLKRLNDIDDEVEFFALIDNNNHELANASGLWDAAEKGDRQVRIHRGGIGESTLTTLKSPKALVDLTALREEFDIPSAFRDEATERKTIIERPRMARCMPVNTTVPLKQDADAEDPFIIYFPSCTRVQRCGGCCNSDLLSCQPTEIRLRGFQVITTEYKNGKFSENRKSKNVYIEEHMNCVCDCKIKQEHCNSLQKYDERACRCKCTNDDDKVKCDNENQIKLWDYDQCICKCREVSECSTGFFFDPQSCSCKPDTVIYSRFQTNPRQGSGYAHQPPEPSPWEQVTGRRNPAQ